jgi:hypothetical protein
MVVGGATVEPCDMIDVDVVSPAVVGVVVLVSMVVGVGTVVVVSGCPAVVGDDSVEVVTGAVVGVVAGGCVVGGAVVGGAVVGGAVVGVVVVGALVVVVVAATVTGVVLVLVLGLVVVVVVDAPMHGPMSRTEVDAVAVKPSVHRACTVSVMLPVTLPGTIVVADVWSDEEPTGPTGDA